MGDRLGTPDAVGILFNVFGYASEDGEFNDAGFIILKLTLPIFKVVFGL